MHHTTETEDEAVCGGITKRVIPVKSDKHISKRGIVEITKKKMYELSRCTRS